MLKWDWNWIRRKQKILHTDNEDDKHFIDYTKINDKLVHAVHNGWHRYLDYRLWLLRIKRHDIEFQHRKWLMWWIFQKYKSVLLSIHISIWHRLRYFDYYMSALVLFGLSSFPLTKSMIDKLDIFQNKRLRRIIDRKNKIRRIVERYKPRGEVSSRVSTWIIWLLSLLDIFYS